MKKVLFVLLSILLLTAGLFVSCNDSAIGNFFNEKYPVPPPEVPENPQVPEDMFCFTAKQAGSKVTLKKSGEPTSINFVYSSDGVIWQDYTFEEEITLAEAGDKVYLRAKDASSTGEFSKTYDSDYYQFVLSGSLDVGGNIMYLADSEGKSDKIGDYAFENLFNGCSALVSAKNLILPNKTSGGCYFKMFCDCSGLTETPVLPAMQLADYCYHSMFRGCTSLTLAPELPAKQLAERCYEAMFTDCSKLNCISVSFTEFNDVGKSTVYWLNGVSSTGTFNCPSEFKTPTSRNGDTIPSGWTVNGPHLISGVFSVDGSGKTVQFTKGNLYWDGDSFELEEKQWDYPTTREASHIGHFNYSKTASVAYADNYNDDSKSTSDILFTNATENTPKTDFTVAEVTGKYRSLSKEEWNFLLNSRIVNGNQEEGNSYQKATINTDTTSVYGLILYPDDYEDQEESNEYTSAEWATMEAAGCVFIPAVYAFRSDWASFDSLKAVYVWTATPNPSNSEEAYKIESTAISTDPFYSSDRSWGFSIRLVKDVTAE